MTITSRSRIRALALGGLIAGMLATFGAAAPGAHALTVFTCGGSALSTYSPAITNTPATTTIGNHWVVGPCLDVLHPLQLRSGESTTSRLVPGATCTGLDSGSSGTRTITWHVGATTTTSTYDYIQTLSSVGAANVIVGNGTITSGDFVGDSILVVQTFASTQFANCGTTGIPSADGAVEVTITGS